MIGDLMGHNEVVLGIDGCLYVVADDPSCRSSATPSPGSTKDIVAHTATVRGVIDVMIKANKSASLVLTKTGIVEYYCRFHPNMKATLTVAP